MGDIRRLLKKMMVITEGVRSDDAFWQFEDRIFRRLYHAERRIWNDAKFSYVMGRLIFYVLRATFGRKV